MPKKKKKSGSRRVSGTKLNPKSPIVMGAAVAIGYFFAAKPINEAIDNAVGTKVDSKIIGAVQIGAGAYLMMGGKKRSIVKTVLGGVIAGVGLKRELTAFGLGGVGGYGQIPVVGRIKRVGGYGQIPVIGSNGIGKYTPNGSVGRYGPNSSVSKVMGSSDGSGSGLLRN